MCDLKLDAEDVMLKLNEMVKDIPPIEIQNEVVRLIEEEGYSPQEAMRLMRKQ
ncbi:hypothetical protein [Vibrio nomapromontoriensis]|uniref:hypothetical protein n=1 Tax=Vibrio nomapromontoriensis TaxID=2910246 RepID=UPI003D1013FA